MGMSNEEIAELMAAGGADAVEDESSEKTDENVETDAEEEVAFISQDEMDSLLSGFVSEADGTHEDLIEEIYDAILDSGKLSLMQWVKLREKLRQIEELVPHIDLIIRLKSKNENKRTDNIT